MSMVSHMKTRRNNPGHTDDPVRLEPPGVAKDQGYSRVNSKRKREKERKKERMNERERERERERKKERKDLVNVRYSIYRFVHGVSRTIFMTCFCDLTSF